MNFEKKNYDLHCAECFPMKISVDIKYSDLLI